MSIVEISLGAGHRQRSKGRGMFLNTFLSKDAQAEPLDRLTNFILKVASYCFAVTLESQILKV